MARQSQTPVQFQRTTRGDTVVGMTSGRAGKVLPVSYIPLLRGDSAAGSITVDFDLAEMPKPLKNAVQANVQAWFIPKSAFPQFSGYDEFMYSYQGKAIKAAGQPDRQPPEFFQRLASLPDRSAYRDSTFVKTLGMHLGGLGNLNTEVREAYNIVQNFRLEAHSSKMTKVPYVIEDQSNQGDLHRAFWPSGKFANMVPDYERALVLGNVDLDISAGIIPVRGIGVKASSAGSTLNDVAMRTTDGIDINYGISWGGTDMRVVNDGDNPGYPNIRADMAETTVVTTLADIDKARQTQAFAKLRTQYAGNDFHGFGAGDVIIAELMQGFRVPEDLYKRPWLLDSKRVTFGMIERHATDGASLEDSVTKGRARATLSLNVPQQDTGGIILIQAEILPEQLHEAAGDPYHHITGVAGFPDALRDVQRPEPVDIVPAWRIDERHTAPEELYGYEPMNAKWNRDFTRLGGVYFQPDAENPFTEARSAIWLAEVVDPSFTQDHYLAPVDFPHDVFSDTLADAVEIAFRHSVAIRGLTQIGDVLQENNDEYSEVSSA